MPMNPWKKLLLVVLLCVSPTALILSQTETGDSLVSDSLTATDSILPSGGPLVYTLTLEGSIGAIKYERIAEAIEQSEEDNASLLIVIMDTPGGFSSHTHTICKAILNSRVPVCTYVAPSGARAGSAGVYIAYASHFVAMAPSTNIGAAHPVAAGGGEIDSVMNEKVTNDAVAQIKAAAEKHGRNVEWAEKAVRQSVSITDNEALSLGVIEYRAEDVDDLLTQINGEIVDMPDGDRRVDVADAKIEEIDTSFAHGLLEIITSPEIVMMLFGLAGLGIMIEIYNPGLILPGVAGAIAGLLALYGLQMLPINYTGLALIILAIVLFIAEVQVVSHGILTIGGIISFFLGGLMLVDTVDPELQVSLSFLIVATIVVGATFAILTWLVVRAHKRQVFTGEEALIGKKAEVRKENMVYVDGALWKAIGPDGAALEVGSTVEVVEVDGLTLKVKSIVS